MVWEASVRWAQSTDRIAAILSEGPAVFPRYILAANSVQRGDPAHGIHSSGSGPSGPEFRIAASGPFDDQTVGARGETALQYRQVVHGDRRLVAPVSGVKVRRPMVVVVDADHDAIEAADLRHPLAPGRLPA